MEKIEYLAYLLEGDYNAYLSDKEVNENNTLTNMSFNSRSAINRSYS
jgi:hypothetical protein